MDETLELSHDFEFLFLVETNSFPWRAGGSILQEEIKRTVQPRATYHVQKECALHTALLVTTHCSSKILSGHQVISCQSTQLVTGKGNLVRKCSLLPCILVCLGRCNKTELRQCVRDRKRSLMVLEARSPRPRFQ